MATEEHLDLIRDISASEQGGEIVELRRLAIISGLETESAEAVMEALDALSLAAQSTLTSHPELVLMQRNPRIIDKKAAEVELVYRHFAENDFQDLSNPPNGLLVFTGDAGLADKTTQVDKADDAIILGYIYPTTDAHFGTETLAKRTATQAGEVSVRIPTDTIRLAGIIAGYDPSEVLAGIVGYVNDGTWNGGAAREWLCAGARWSPWTITGKKYKYEFTFERNSDGWDQKAVFVHGATGRVVSDWATNSDGAGHDAFKVVDWYPEADFSNYWNTFGFST